MKKNRISRTPKETNMKHYLKTWPEFYDLMESGDKNFELRKDDRDYNKGDTLHLQKYDMEKGYYGKYMEVLVTCVVRNVPEFGLTKGFCIMSTKKLN